jgi:hypothetical protein
VIAKQKVGTPMKKILGLVLVSLLCLSNSSLSKETRSYTGYSTRTTSTSHHSKSYCYSCTRDSKARSSAARKRSMTSGKAILASAQAKPAGLVLGTYSDPRAVDCSAVIAAMSLRPPAFGFA